MKYFITSLCGHTFQSDNPFGACPQCATVAFGPGWPIAQPEAPDLVAVPFTEAVELLLKHWSPSVQMLLETLKTKYGIILARPPK